MRVKRLIITVLAVAAGTVGIAPAVAAPLAAAFGDSPAASAPAHGDTTIAGRSWTFGGH